MLSSQGTILLLPILLAGCLGTASDQSDVVWPDGPNAVSLLTGEVVIDAPDGYCLDPSASQLESSAKTVFFAACGPGHPHVAMSAVVSAQKTPGILGGEGVAALSRFFATERGRKSLSRSGKADRVTVRANEAGEGILVLQLTDTSPAAKTGISPSYMRAITELNGYLVTFSVLPFSDLNMPDEAVRNLLDQLVLDSRIASSPPAPEGDEQ